MKTLCKMLLDEIMAGKDPTMSSASVLCFGSLFAAAERSPILNPFDDLLEEIYEGMIVPTVRKMQNLTETQLSCCTDWVKHFEHPEDRMVIPASSYWLAVMGKCETARKKYTEKVITLIVHLYIF